MADPASLTTWTTPAKIAGVGIAAVLVVGAVAAVRGAGRCGRLQRWYTYAVRQGGQNDYEASGLRAEAKSRGCEWAKEIEDRREQDRYWQARTAR